MVCIKRKWLRSDLRIDVAAAVEVEVVGVGAVRVRGRRPVVAVVAGILEQIAGILITDA